MFNVIPFNKRSAVYSRSIKLHNHLWTVPTYNSGEVWKFYGGFSTDHHTIMELFKDSNQVLTMTPDGCRHLYGLDEFGYASSGTPSMRIRIS